MTAGAPASLAATYFPSACPASRLLVTYAMSTASFGVVGLSSARTMTPAARALRMAGTTPGPAGVIRMVETPDATAVSMALDWTSSELPTLLDVMARSTPSLAASALAASAIFLKYGFVSAATSKATLGRLAEALLEQAS